MSFLNYNKEMKQKRAVNDAIWENFLSTKYPSINNKSSSYIRLLPQRTITYIEAYLKEPAVSDRGSLSSSLVGVVPLTQCPVFTPSVCITLTWAAPGPPGALGHNSSFGIWAAKWVLFGFLCEIYLVGSFGFIAVGLGLQFFFLFRAVQIWQSHRDRDYSTTYLESLDYVSIFSGMDQSLRADQRWLSRMDQGHDTTKTWWWWWQDGTEGWTHVLPVLFWVAPCQTAWSWSQSSQFQELGIPDSELLTNSLKRLFPAPFLTPLKLCIALHYLLLHAHSFCDP